MSPSNPHLSNPKRRRLFGPLSFSVLILTLSSPTLRAQTPAAPAFSSANVYNAPIAGEALHNNRSNIVIGVPGWTSSPAFWWLDGSNSWNMPGMASTLRTALGANANNWDVWGLDWSQGAAGNGVYPSTANEINAQLQGEYIAKQVIDGSYTSVDLLGHSLGARVIQTATSIIKQMKPSVIVDETFLDAYQPYNWGLVFGSGATYAQQYYTDLDTISGPLTAGMFPNALNVNMDAYVQPVAADYNVSNIGALNTESWIHNQPVQFYKATAANPNNYGGYGYSLSQMAGAALPPGGAKFQEGQNISLYNNGTVNSVVALNPVVDNATNKLHLGIANNLITGSANAVVNPNADNFQLNAYDSSATTPLGYLNITLVLTQPADYFTFNYQWLDLIDGTGELTFNLWSPSGGFLNGAYTQLLWAADSVNGFNDTLSTDKIIWTSSSLGTPNANALPAGSYELRFRLDDQSGTQTSIQISDIQTGLITVPEPSSLMLMACVSVGLLTRRRRGA